ncbi:MAG: hypothetical protein KDC10_04555 [Calditrichaeota bacterium]|nr:hypothetical protein [Calditrichota bacterium]
MGAWFTFRCKGCGFLARRISGGRDVGMRWEVETQICKDCRRPVNVPIAFLGNPVPGEAQDPQALLHHCPLCKGTNLELWKDTHPCPRCDSPMEIDRDMVTIYWD